MRAINGYQKNSRGGDRDFSRVANSAWIQEATGGCGDRDPTLPDRASDYCRYCWALAAEIAALAGKRLDRRASASSDALKLRRHSWRNVRSGNISDRDWGLPQNDFL